VTRGLLALTAALLAGTCSACGSTVQMRSSGLGTAPQGSELSGPGEVSGTAGAPGLGTAGIQGPAPVNGAGGAGLTTGSSSTTVGSAGGTAPESGGQAALTAKGVTTTQVLIGYSTSKALSSVAGSLGLKGVDVGDTKAQVEAVVKDLNARGGLLGRKVVLKPYDVSTSSNASQEMCSAWTQDAHVFAVVDAVNVGAPVTNENLAACLSKASVPLLTGAPLISQLSFNRYPFVIAPGHAASERYMTGLVASLVRDDYFRGWNAALGAPGAGPIKIGINSFDTPGDQNRVKELTRALRAAGYSNIIVAKHPSDPTGVPASTQSAVLRFKAEGVTHVFGASVFFYQDADSQNFRPRYAVDDSANTVQLMAQNAPKSQLHGSLGAGYLPMSEDDSYNSTNAAAKNCLRIMRDAGIDTTNRFATTYMLAVCDRFWVLERAVTASGALTPSGVLQGLGRLPTGMDSAGTYAMTLGPAHRDGAFRLRSFSYVDSCSCFRLAGPTTQF
jgi:ABC-type branched-subunit amino acid transport system substrate-binding protein